MLKSISSIISAVVAVCTIASTCGTISTAQCFIETETTCQTTTLTDQELNALENECKGYGQGHECDDMNRPLGALNFNAQYSKYGGYALFEDKKEICLTFDQGYENGYTAPILDTLKEKNAKAVFFLTGDYARRNPELVKRMIDEGHTIGNHGLDHASLPKLSYEEAKKEIMDNHNYVKETYGVEMKYFRPPCGEFSEKSIAIAQQFGYDTILWSFAYCDWDVNNQPDVATGFDKVSKSAHEGEILLLHSVSSTNSAILGDVIDSFREQGFEISAPK